MIGSEAFDRLLREVLIPEWCADPRRNAIPSGFRPSGASLTSIDADDFVRVWELNVLQAHKFPGTYRAPRSAASEQFFWNGPKASVPCPYSLWVEPIITIAALGRLYWEYGWPLSLLGTQSKDGAFDLQGFDDRNGLVLAGEVKKTVSELRFLTEWMISNSREAEAPPLLSGKALNAHRKLTSLRKTEATVFWAVGPGRQQLIYRVIRHGELLELQAADEEALYFCNCQP